MKVPLELAPAELILEAADLWLVVDLRQQQGLLRSWRSLHHRCRSHVSHGGQRILSVATLFIPEIRPSDYLQGLLHRHAMVIARQQEPLIRLSGSLHSAIGMKFLTHPKGLLLRGLIPDGTIHVGQVREVQRLWGKTDQDGHRHPGMAVGTGNPSYLSCGSVHKRPGSSQGIQPPGSTPLW